MRATVASVSSRNGLYVGRAWIGRQGWWWAAGLAAVVLVAVTAPAAASEPDPGVTSLKSLFQTAASPKATEECSGGLVYDDGSFENGYSPGNGGGFVMRFDPSSYPAEFDQICLCFTQMLDLDTSLDFDLVVYQADGTGGGPGTVLLESSRSAIGIPEYGSDNPDMVFYEYDMSHLGITVSEPVYVGVNGWDSGGFIFLCADENGPGGQAAYVQEGSASTWEELPSVELPDYQALGIRVDFAGGGPPPEVPEISVVVPAASRGAGAQGSVWSTNLYILNSASQQADITVYWLERDEANPDPVGRDFTVGSDSTLVLDDVILNSFGMQSAGGAFAIASNRAIVVNSAIVNTSGGTEFGQGFEGIPIASAVEAGETTHVVGLKDNSDYRTNVYLVDVSGSGSVVDVALLDEFGSDEATRRYTLGAYEPVLDPVSELGGPSFDDGSLRLSVVSGAVVGGASRINSDSGDPLTLSYWRPAGSGGPPPGECGGDGSYVGFFDFTYEGGLRIDVAGDALTYVEGSVIVFSPEDGGSNCANVFGFGGALDPAVEIAGDGSFETEFAFEYTDWGTLTFVLEGTLDGDTLSGTATVTADPTLPADCSGELNQVPFYAGHTNLVLPAQGLAQAPQVMSPLGRLR